MLVTEFFFCMMSCGIAQGAYQSSRRSGRRGEYLTARYACGKSKRKENPQKSKRWDEKGEFGLLVIMSAMGFTICTAIPSPESYHTQKSFAIIFIVSSILCMCANQKGHIYTPRQTINTACNSPKTPRIIHPKLSHATSNLV